MVSRREGSNVPSPALCASVMSAPSVGSPTTVISAGLPKLELAEGVVSTVIPSSVVDPIRVSFPEGRSDSSIISAASLHPFTDRTSN